MTGIVTFQNQLNYGGVLQAVALFRTLRTLTDDVYFADFRCKESNRSKKRHSNALWALYEWSNRVREAVESLPWPGSYVAYIRRRMRTRAFLRAECPVFGPTIRDADETAQLPFETVIVGSDQVWNPNAPLTHRTCLLPAAPPTTKKYSYAASLGAPAVPEETKRFFRDCIRSFRCASVREPSSVPVVEELAGPGVPVRWDIDPTLLLDAEDWNGVARPVDGSGEPYTAIYWLGGVSDLERVVSALPIGRRIVLMADWEGMLSRFIVSGTARLSAFRDFVRRRRIEARLDAGPREFLGWIRGAADVVTNSFHGMVFSALFHRPVRLVAERAGTRAQQRARLVDFARRYGLSDCIGSVDALPDGPVSDFTVFEESVRSDRLRSVEYLRAVASREI